VTGVECGGGARASLHPRTSLFCFVNNASQPLTHPTNNLYPQESFYLMLKLNVGSNRKIGQPDFGSAGASCNFEPELDTGLFQDLDGLQQVVKRAYAACNQAVQDELARIAGDTGKNTQPQEVIEVRTSPAISGTGIHTAIEQHFQAILSGDPKPDLDGLLFAYRSAWLPHDPDAIQFGSAETRASLDGLASKMLTAFLNSPAASVHGRVLGVEEEIRACPAFPDPLKHKTSSSAFRKRKRYFVDMLEGSPSRR
jgi:hypothetical protein